MLNIIWLGLILCSVVIAVFTGRVDALVTGVTKDAKQAFEIALGLVGVMAFWLGLMQIAESSGLIQVLARLLKPLMVRLFPDVPSDHPAMGAMLLNMTANMLGLNNAATPFGLKAMEQLESLNPTPGVATNAMCTFLAINTSSVQLIPATAIAFLVAAGSTHPTSIIATGLFATTCSTIAGLTAVKLLERASRYRLKEEVAS